MTLREIKVNAQVLQRAATHESMRIKYVTINRMFRSIAQPLRSEIINDPSTDSTTQKGEILKKMYWFEQNVLKSGYYKWI